MDVSTQSQICPRCGSPVTELLCDGLCARCVASGIVAGQADPFPREEAEDLVRFDNLTLIGSGGMGAVYEAYDRKLARPVALKFLHADLLSNPAARLRFELETLIAGQLEHPGVIPVYDAGQDVEGRPFYVMRKVKGTTLSQVLERLLSGDPSAVKTFGLKKLLQIFDQLCTAIAYAHSRGVIHRDLKPANVMIGEFGEVFVMDWGLAKPLGNSAPARLIEAETFFSQMESYEHERALRLATLHSDTSPNAVLGTLGFMAPEQAEGNTHEADERTDIYALGAILYNMLTLHPPVSGSGNQSILQKTAKGQIVHPLQYNPRLWWVRAPHLPHCPKGRIHRRLADAAMKALSKSTAHRYQTVAELQAVVKNFL